MTVQLGVSGLARGAQLRRAIAVSPLSPYEKWTGTSLSTSQVSAERILRDGWARVGEAPLKLSGPIPWDDFTAATRSWSFFLNCLDPIDELLSAHSLTAQDHFLKAALQFALSWVENHSSLEATQGSMAWYDMAIGMRAYRMSYILDASARQAWSSDEQLCSLYESLELHRRELSDDAKVAFHSNHGFYQIAGQLAMGRRFGHFDTLMKAAFDQARARLTRMLDAQFTVEGVHTEHSPGYHQMVFETLKGLGDAGLLDAESLRRMDDIERALSWFVLPNGYLANLGDTDYRSRTRSVAVARSKWRTPEMLFAATGGRLGKSDGAGMKVFPRSGYFVVRGSVEPRSTYDGGSYLVQSAAFHSRTHKHADDLSFIWFDHGNLILVDAGRYGYIGKTERGSPLWDEGFWYSDPNRLYCESTRAHNTVEIDGRSYPRRGVKPYGSALRRCGSLKNDVYFSECEVKHFKSIRHVRVLVYKPGHWLVVCDWLHDNMEVEHDYRQWFHLAPELSLQQEGDDFVCQLPGAKAPLRVAPLLPNVTASRPALGVTRPALQGWWSPKDKTMLPNYAFAYQQRARSGLFATVFAFCNELRARDSSRMAPSGRNAHLCWEADGFRHVLVFSRPDDDAMHIGVEIDAIR